MTSLLSLRSSQDVAVSYDLSPSVWIIGPSIIWLTSGLIWLLFRGFGVPSTDILGVIMVAPPRHYYGGALEVY